MRNVMRASDLNGLPVVSIASGEDIAEVRDVVYDAERHALIGFTLNKRGMLAGRLDGVLSAASVAAIGADAVMVDRESALDGLDDSPDLLERIEDAIPVIGNRVVSAEGNVLGEVVGVIVTTGSSAKAVGYEVDSADRSDSVFVPISEQMVLSGDNLLLPERAAELIRNDLTGFGAAISASDEMGGDQR